MDLESAGRIPGLQREFSELHKKQELLQEGPIT